MAAFAAAAVGRAGVVTTNAALILLSQVHTIAELERMLKLESLEGCMLGINNRDLQVSECKAAWEYLGACTLCCPR